MLSIGASGVRAYQSALTTTSENIANAGSTGYSRRTATLGEIVSSASANATMGGQLSGYGVRIAGVERQSDPFRAAEVRHSGAELARSQTSVVWLERIEVSLDGYDLAGRMSDFYTSAQSLAADPASPAPRAAMIEAASSLATAIQGTAQMLATSMSDLDGTATLTTAQLNELSSSLAKVNVSLGRVAPGSADQAQLFDERDRLLGDMSKLVDIHVTTDARGLATVHGGNASGPTLVALDIASVVRFERSGGAVLFTSQRPGETAILSPAGGALAGMVEGAARINDATSELNAIATDIANGINAILAGGEDLDGNPGTPMFAMGADASSFTLAMTDGRRIAAASVGGGPRDNGNLVALEAGRRSTGTEDRAGALVSGNAATLAARRSVATAQGAIHANAVLAREQVSGVNLDEEAVDLIRFQQAYQASSRVIQIARDTLQNILDIR